ncbi:hypothetical protein MMC31_008147 [Peltigera leucophlebia]|nr:hypothetical protein [Peltigera leucophlebia]
MLPAHPEPYGCSDFYQDQDASLVDPHPWYPELQSSDTGLGVGASKRQVSLGLGEQCVNYSTIGQGGALTLSPNQFPTNIIAPLAFAAKDEATLLWSTAGLGNISFKSNDNTFETSPSTLSSVPYGYHSKTRSVQFILVAGRNSFIDISSNGYPGSSQFFGLSVSQTTYDTENWPVEVDEFSQFYPAANLGSVDSRPVWDVNARSTSSTDPVNLWTGPLMNGAPNSNQAPIPLCQSMNDPNMNRDCAFGPIADFHDFTGSYLAPSLDYHVAGSNLNAEFPRFEDSSGPMFDTSLGYNATPAIANELLSQDTLTVMEPKALAENDDSFPQAQSGNPDGSISSEISPENHDDHEPVKSAFPNTCMECNQSFKKVNDLYYHCRRESHAAFMCKCGERYTRSDVLNRHVKTNRPEPQKYTCPHCKSRRGGKSFKRKDHLTQHIRGYHHIGTHESYNVRDQGFYLCPHSNCPQYREPESFDWTIRIWFQNKPFDTYKGFIQHMRTVHDDTPFQCDVSGCSRVRSKGYVREMGLIKHRKREHPDAPKFKALYSCRLPGCSGIGESYDDIRGHYMKEHGHSEQFASGLAQWWSRL